MSLSASDVAAGIGGTSRNGAAYGDAFDLFAHFEHGGDFDAAVRAYGGELRDRGEVAPKVESYAAASRWEQEDAAHLAGQAGRGHDADLGRGLAKIRPDAAPPKRTSTFKSAASWKGLPVPEREWLVHGLVPSKTVTLFSGDGGTGKSLLALQLAVSVAAGTGWIGRGTACGRVIFLSAEDDEDELHRRTNDILRATGRDYDDLDGLTVRSLAGEDALLAVESQLALIQSELFAELDAQAERDDPALIVIDTLADVFPSNENDRAKARQFIGILRGLALKRRCAVVLLSHPSLSGLTSGAGTSGSTGWNNSVRSRLYLSRITDEGFEPDPDARILATKKANYGRTGGEMRLTWKAGVFEAEA